MANICKYKVEVRGPKNACFAFWGSMSASDDGQLLEEEGDDLNHKLRFLGFCKWSVDAYCNPYEGQRPVEIPDDPDQAYWFAMNHYMFHTVQERSEMFDVEVFCCSNDIDDFFPEEEIYEHYICGAETENNEDEYMHRELEITDDWFE